MKLELSARPDFGHALGALGGMVYNVWVNIAIFRWRREVRWRSAVMAPQDYGQANGSFLRGQGTGVRFT